MLGARAAQAAIVARHPDADAVFLIVWTDMLSKDGQRTARASARMFSDPRVRQFHDPLRLVGAELTTRAFAGWADTAAAAMRGDDPMRQHLLDRARDAPTWDVYLFYGPEARWGESIPRPPSWIKQVGLRSDGVTVGWMDDFATPVRSFDLAEEMRRLGDAWLAARAPAP